MIARHLRHNAVAYLALVVAMSTGTSYAAAQIANGSVTTKKLAKNAVVSKKVKNGSLRGVDVLDGSITGVDLAAGSVGSGQLVDGSVTDDDLGTGSVGSAEVKNGSLTAPDLAIGSVGTGEVKDGSLTAADLAASVMPQVLVDVGPDATDPRPNPIGAAAHTLPFTFARAGQAYVRWSRPLQGIDCSGGSSARVGLYVDGAPVPKSSIPLASASSARYIEVAAVVTLTSGAHTFDIRWECDPGDYPGAGWAEGTPTWTVIGPGA